MLLNSFSIVSIFVSHVFDLPVCSLHCLAILMSCSRKPCTATDPSFLSDIPSSPNSRLHPFIIYRSSPELIQMDGGAHWSRRIEPNPKILPKILREPAARDFQSQGESQPLKGCPEPCLQGRTEEMAQQSAKRDCTTHLLKHVGTLETFDEDNSIHQRFSDWGSGPPRGETNGYKFNTSLHCKKC